MNKFKARYLFTGEIFDLTIEKSNFQYLDIIQNDYYLKENILEIHPYKGERVPDYGFFYYNKDSYKEQKNKDINLFYVTEIPLKEIEHIFLENKYFPIIEEITLNEKKIVLKEYIIKNKKLHVFNNITNIDNLDKTKKIIIELLLFSAKNIIAEKEFYNIEKNCKVILNEMRKEYKDFNFDLIKDCLNSIYKNLIIYKDIK